MGTYKKIPYFLSTVLLTAGCGDNNSKNSISISNSKPQESLSNNLFHQQWYLKNIGQELFGTEVAKENFDINLTIPNSYTGSNVKVLVADSGVDFNHPNLNKSILNNSSIDFTVSSPLPFENINPKLTIGINSEDTEEDHGTNVAGIIGANPLDNKFTGIAPRVQIASANVVSKFINKSTLSIVDKRLKIYNHAENKEINIINESYGSKSENFFNDANKIINKNINDTIKNNYRIENKKGFIIVKSAGNYSCDSEEALFNETKEEIIYDYINNSKLLTDSEKLYFKSLRPNLSQTNLISSNPYTITVANATAHGIINKSSSIGANIWITAFGGGNHSAQKHDNLMSAYPNIPINNILLDWKNKYLPNIFSTRIHNTNESIDSSLKYADLREEEKKYYTTGFSGTSAAAPMVTGVIALMLQANPNLTLRDVKYILAKTANSDIVKNFEPKPYCIKILQRIGGFNDNFNTLWDEEQWVSNKANFKFNNYYGFGLINADKAIEEAKSSDYPKFKGKAFEFEHLIKFDNLPIKPNTSLTKSFHIPNNLKIESIQVTPALLAFQSDGLGIKIESPSGTKNILLYPGNSFISKENNKIKAKIYPVTNYSDLENNNEYNFSYLSNAFYQESSEGEWKITIFNSSKDVYETELADLLDIKLRGLKIKIIGENQ